MLIFSKFSRFWLLKGTVLIKTIPLRRLRMLRRLLIQPAKTFLLRSGHCLLAVLFLLVCSVAVSSAAEPSAGPEPIITSAAESGYPPFSIVTAQGQAAGFAVELLEAALERMGYGVTFKTGPWLQVKQWLVEGKVDVLPLVGRTPEREAVFDFTFPYLRRYGTILVREDEQTIAGLADLRGKTVAVLQADNAEEFVRRSELGATIVTTDSFDVALLNLSRGSYDAVVIQKQLAYQLMDKLGIDNLRSVGPPLKEFVQSFCFAVPEGETELLALLNEGLAIVIADGTFRHLQAEWFAAPSVPAKSRLMVGGDKSFPPYEYLDENGQPTGFNVELTRAIAQEMNIPVRIELADWATVRNRLKTGEIDAIQGMFYSVERDRVFDFSPLHSLVNHSIVTRKKSPQLTSLADLADRSILVMKGDIMHDIAVSQGLSEQLTTVDSQEEALRRLAAGEYDCVLAAKIPALFWINKHGWSNLHVSSASVLSSEYCYAVGHENRELLAGISDALATLKASGEYRKLYSKWFSVYEQDPFDVRTALFYSAIIFLPALLILSGVIVWNRSLKKQVSARTEKLTQEIAERKKTEQALGDERGKLRTLFEHVTDYALVLRPEPDDLIIADLSESACRQHGYTRQELLGQSLNLLDADGIDNEKKAEYLKRLDQGEKVQLQVTHRRKDGSLFPVEAAVKKISIDGEELLYSIEKDISARKQAELANQRLEIELRQKHKMEAVGVLAGGMAHNFNNNLSVILGNLELAQIKSSGNNEVQRFLAPAKTALLNSRDLIKQIMTYTRTDEKSKSTLILSDLVEENYRLVRQTTSSAVAITLAVADDSRDKAISASKGQIQEIFLNLCNNATQAMDNKGNLTISLNVQESLPEKVLKRGSAPACPFLCLGFKDTGSGIPEEHLEKIFDPFFTTKEVNEGTGMGLATVQGIVEAHDGFINVSSQLGQGTLFELYFPVVDREPTPVEKIENNLPNGKERILLIDDDEMLVDVGKDMLETLGYLVSVQTNPRAALELIKKDPSRFDLIMTDQTMPQLTGLELARQVKQHCPGMPIVLCTGYNQAASELAGDQSGISAVCMKPLKMAELGQVVRSCLDTL
jgi:two-component system sensor histidine kinase EvgS